MRGKVFAALALLGMAVGSLGSTPLAAQPGAPSASSAAGDRAQQLAQLIENIIPLAVSRDWDAAYAAFPAAQWQAQNETIDSLRGNRMREVRGQIRIAGLAYGITITGTLDQLWDVTLDAPEDARPALSWNAIGSALAARQVQAQLVVCADGPRGDGYRILSHQGRSAWLNFYTRERNGGESFHFGFESPYNPASDEAGLRQMMRDRCGRRR